MMEQKNHSLTYDEKKAAEAAFRGLPFNPHWSEAAHKVYRGISAAMGKQRTELPPEVRTSGLAMAVKKTEADTEQMSRIMG